MKASPEPPRSAAPPPSGPPPAGRRGYWREAVWRRYKKSRLGMLALAVVGFLSLVAAAAPFIAGTRPIACRFRGTWYFPALYSYRDRQAQPGFLFAERRGMYLDEAAGPLDNADLEYPRLLAKVDPGSIAIWPLFYADPYRRVGDGEWRGRPADPLSAPPSARNPLGTDGLGRDVLARVIHGTSIALLVGFVTMGIAAAIGIVIGALAGYFGSWVDATLSRLIELVQSIPPIILILALIALLQRCTIWHLMVVIGCTRWESIARYVRGEFLRLKQSEFVLAARALGATPGRIMLRHMLPNALAPVVVTVTFGIAGAIILESSLSFLGLPGDTDSPSWGRLLNEGFQSLGGDSPHWWLVVFPGLGIFLAVLVYNLVGDRFQEAIDPRHRP
jgi:peptide/nickel transport system permease protein